MSKSGSGSILLDELPVMGRPDSEQYVRAFREYVTTMKELAPNHPSHPTGDWLNEGFAMILLEGSRKPPLPPSKALQVPVERKLGVCLHAGSPPCNGTWLLQQLEWPTFGLGWRRQFKVSG